MNSLQDLQQQVKKDELQLVASLGGGKQHQQQDQGHVLYRLASLFFQILLPNDAVRVLMHTSATYVDGVHLAFAAHALELPASCVSSAAIEDGSTSSSLVLHHHRHHQHHSATTTARLVNRYCRVLLDNGNSGSWLTATIYTYFAQLLLAPRGEFADVASFPPGFVSFCSDDATCSKLFGFFGGPTSTLQEASKLMKQAFQKGFHSALKGVADECSKRGSYELAIHIMLALESTVQDADKPNVVLHAMRILISVLSTIAHQNGIAASESLVVCSRQLAERTRKDSSSLPADVMTTFDSLTKIVEFLTHAAHRNVDQALDVFYTLSFAPRMISASVLAQEEEVARAANEFNLSTTEEVQTALPGAVKLLARIILGEFQRSSSVQRKEDMRVRYSMLTKWVACWKGQISREVHPFLASMGPQLL
jgi:hypothetical protein